MTHDPDLDAILARASTPHSPVHGPRDIMAAIEAKDKVVAFPRRRHVPWAAVTALAASLAFGIYLGATGGADALLGIDTVAEFDGFGGFDASEDDVDGDVS